MVKNLPAMQETRGQSLGWEVPLEKGMATHSSILAWRIPWTEKPGRLQSMGSQRVRHDWATNTCAHLLRTAIFLSQIRPHLSLKSCKSWILVISIRMPCRHLKPCKSVTKVPIFHQDNRNSIFLVAQTKETLCSFLMTVFKTAYPTYHQILSVTISKSTQNLFLPIPSLNTTMSV